MYKILCLIRNPDLLAGLQKLRVWGPSGYTIAAVVQTREEAQERLAHSRYDLIIAEAGPNGPDGTGLLRRAGRHHQWGPVLLCSEIPDYPTARQAVLYGAWDYLVPPFRDVDFIALFGRLNRDAATAEAVCLCAQDALLTSFEKRPDHFPDLVRNLLADLCLQASSEDQGDRLASELTRQITASLFSRWDWLSLYIPPLPTPAGSSASQPSCQKTCRDILCRLYRDFCELLPGTANPNARQAILYILRHPEGDLCLGAVAQTLDLNRTYLSSVFAASTGIHFGDYLTTVRLHRAAFLLQTTPCRIGEIAARLDYKDMAYFSRLFKARYHMTPTQYRIPLRGDFQI